MFQVFQTTTTASLCELQYTHELFTSRGKSSKLPEPCLAATPRAREVSEATPRLMVI